jgi:uncharacterized SAM-binding protein YcdF (DUF218 family)
VQYWLGVSDTIPRRVACACARGLALLVGAFAVANFVGGLLRPGFDANRWWLDTRPVPDAFSGPLVAVGGALLAAWGVRPEMSSRRRGATVVAAAALACVAAFDTVRVVVLAVRGLDTFPVPFSAFVVAGFAWIAWEAASRAPSRGRLVAALACAAVWAALLPMGWMLAFGSTDYRRPADAIVVLGARAYADGRPSWALADRVRTGCELWHEGLAPRLILSGGPGDGAVHETQAMRRLALDAGVPDDAIWVDAQGVDSRSTVENTARLLCAQGLASALVVSHGYHLPRLKMAFERAGVRAYTVPVRDGRRLPAMPWYVAREVAALWTYWLVPPR